MKGLQLSVVLITTALLVSSSFPAAVKVGSQSASHEAGEGEALTCLQCTGRNMSLPEEAPANTQACTVRHYDPSKIATKTVSLTKEEAINNTLVCMTANVYLQEANQGQAMAYRAPALLPKGAPLHLSAWDVLDLLGAGVPAGQAAVVDVRICNSTECNNNAVY